ncbi:MAG: hypothetical protein M1497_02495 [Nitrospirae bacterium]|nr:hypothetical protein [Nitrospirota bacterium]
MPEKEKPLPRPPKTAFTKKRFGEDEENAPTADRMAAAMAEGKLEEFIKQEIPDNEYARTLAGMMMGMTGMLPPEGLSFMPAEKTESSEQDASGPHGQGSFSDRPPEDVVRTVQSGDVKGLTEMLRREHLKRTPDGETVQSEEEKKEDSSGPEETEKQTLDQLIEIAGENNLSVDWVVLRALKLYIREYRSTGRL